MTPALSQVSPFLAKAPVVGFAPGIAIVPVVAPYARNEEIYAEEDAAKFVYKVVSGAVRVVRLLSDGRRHISAFYLPGEVFGCEPGDVHRFSAEAIVDSRIALVRRSAIEDLTGHDPDAARAMWALAAEDLRRLQEHMVLLGRRSAVQRVATFLLELAERAHNDHVVEAPMSRSDMADYLGLTIETVSRTLSQLERDGLISLPATRRIVLNNRRALAYIDG